MIPTVANGCDGGIGYTLPAWGAATWVECSLLKNRSTSFGGKPERMFGREDGDQPVSRLPEYDDLHISRRRHPGFAQSITRHLHACYDPVCCLLKTPSFFLSFFLSPNKADIQLFQTKRTHCETLGTTFHSFVSSKFFCLFPNVHRLQLRIPHHTYNLKVPQTRERHGRPRRCRQCEKIPHRTPKLSSNC